MRMCCLLGTLGGFGVEHLGRYVGTTKAAKHQIRDCVEHSKGSGCGEERWIAHITISWEAVGRPINKAELICVALSIPDQHDWCG